jgi:hypothetical protein
MWRVEQDDEKPTFHATVHCRGCGVLLSTKMAGEDMVVTHPAPACDGWANAELFDVRPVLGKWPE